MLNVKKNIKFKLNALKTCCDSFCVSTCDASELIREVPPILFIISSRLAGDVILRIFCFFVSGQLVVVSVE